MAKRPKSNQNVSRPGTITRRGLLASAAGIAAATATSLGTTTPTHARRRERRQIYRVVNGRINQSVCHWCFQPMPLEELARAAAEMGMKSVEFVAPKDWPMLKKLGLACAITGSHGFERGMNNPEHHAECIEKLEKAIEATSAAGFSSVITFSGFAGNIDRDQGIANCVTGLKKVIGLAEKKKVNLCLEILNSRVDIKMKGHPGYQADTVEYGIEVCKRIGSPRMKILFDCYHVQIMQGDIITRIRKYAEYIGHYHTAGNPGRNELDDTQEMHYPGIMNAIAATGYKGYVGHEFLPEKSDDKLAALNHAVRLCDV